jgi:hypothetical protein
MDDVSSQLPPGWIRHENEEIGAFYYYNTVTGVSQWEHPSEGASSIDSIPSSHLLKPPVGWAPSFPVRAIGTSSAYPEIEANIGSANGVLCNNILSGSESEIASGQTQVGGKQQDYIGLARLYKIQQPYRGTTIDPICVLCHRETCREVFFPCEHRCVCKSCIKSECICGIDQANQNQNSHTTCPLCASIIRIILPFANGAEKDQYWNWVEEVKPELPPGFIRDWRHSAAVIQKVYIDEKYVSVKSSGCNCTLS